MTDKNSVALALARVPATAPNREALARLLVEVESTCDHIAADQVQASWHARLTRCALALHKAKQAAGTRDYGSANGAFQRSIDAARNYARRNKLLPNTRAGVLAEAGYILDALE
jgi:hypothetical protein